MRLSEGTAAPDFEASNWNGESVRLSDFKSRKLWLAFFRYASCPLCNLRVHDIIKRFDTLTANGLAIVGVFQSPSENIREYVGKQAPPFPLLSDPEEKLYRLYGLETSLAGYLSPANFGRIATAMTSGFGPGRMDGSKTRIPGDFLIEPAGKIASVYYGEVIADHIPFERVERFAST